MAFLRPFRPSDHGDTASICRATLAPSLTTSKDAWRLAPYLWTHQFTHLCPSNCFILDDGTGRAVGYCIGCPSIPQFGAAYDSYITDVLDHSDEITRPANMTTPEEWRLPDGEVNGAKMEQLAYSHFWLMEDGNEGLIRDGYTAMLHIDLLDDFQGQGWGRKLIEMFMQSLAGKTEAGCKGVFLGIAKDNSKVIKFYEKCGFRMYDKGDGSLCMVRDI